MARGGEESDRHTLPRPPRTWCSRGQEPTVLSSLPGAQRDELRCEPTQGSLSTATGSCSAAPPSPTGPGRARGAQRRKSDRDREGEREGCRQRSPVAHHMSPVMYYCTMQAGVVARPHPYAHARTHAHTAHYAARLVRVLLHRRQLALGGAAPLLGEGLRCGRPSSRASQREAPRRSQAPTVHGAAVAQQRTLMSALACPTPSNCVLYCEAGRWVHVRL